MVSAKHGKSFEKLYKTYNKRSYVHPDPLEFLYNYEDVRDREIVGMIASSLAYGRVQQILKSVSLILDKMGNSPLDYLLGADLKFLKKEFLGFKHRFADGESVSNMLWGLRNSVEKNGSLENIFLKGLGENDENVIPAMNNFIYEIMENGYGKSCHLLPLPEKGSACKRMNLFLRWMVRNDSVDPGGWSNVDPSKLIIPLDVHMHRITERLGYTSRKQANMKTAIEVTEAFGLILPEDPVKYDFSLTRLGIRDDADYEMLFGGISK